MTYDDGFFKKLKYQLAHRKTRRKVWGRVVLSLSLSLSGLLFALIFLLTGLPVDAAGEIVVSKSVSSPAVTAGEPFTYTLLVTNTTGGNLVTIITDVLPSAVTVVDPGSGAVQNGAVVWNDTVPQFGTNTYTFSVVATQAGNVVNDQYMAESGSYFDAGAPVTTTIVAGSPAQVNLVASPNPNVVGASTALTVTLADVYGNPIQASNPVTVTFDNGRLGGDTSGTVITQTDPNGYLITTLDGITVPGTTHITATSGSFVRSAVVTYTHGAPSVLIVDVVPTVIPADGSTGATITATVRDQYNNPVTLTPVGITSTLGIVTLSFGGLPNAQGQARGTLVGDTVAGTTTITVTAGSLVDASHQVYLSPGPPNHLYLTASPASITADGTSTATVTLLVTDQYNNPVDPSSVTINTSRGTLSGGGTTYVGTTVNGQVQPTLTAGTVAGTAFLTATAGIFQATTAVDFAPGPPAKILLDIAPPQIVANGSSTSTITATIRDTFDNLINTLTTVTFTAQYGTLSQNVVTTSNGIASVVLQSTTALVATPITATADYLGTPATGVVTFTVGPATNALLTLTPASVITVGVPITVAATIKDDWGHAVPASPVTFTTSLGSITPSSGLTDGSGQVQATLESTRTGTAIIGMVGPAGLLAVSGGTAQFNPDTSVKALLVATPTELFANGSTTSAITATLVDRFGNRTFESGVALNFAATRGTLSGSGATDSNGVAVRTLTSDTSLGPAVVSVTNMVTPTSITISFVAGDPTDAVLTAVPATATAGDYLTLYITVTDSISHPIANRTFPVTRTLGGALSCGPTDASGMLICASQIFTQSLNPLIYVNGVQAHGDSITINPAALDHVEIIPSGSAANPVLVTAGVPFTFTAAPHDVYHNLRSDTVTWNQPASLDGKSSGTIDSNGVFVGQKAGSMFLLAQAGDKFGSNYVQIQAGAPARAKITASPDTVPADNGSTANLTIEIRDAYDNPVSAGYPILVESSIGTVEGTGTTDSNGKVYRTIKSAVAGQATFAISSTVTGQYLTITPDSNPYVTFTPGLPDHATVSVSSGATYQNQPNSSTLQLHANGVDTAILNFTVYDALNNPVSSGHTIDVQAWPNTLSGSGQTDASGTLTRTLTTPLVEGTAVFTVSYLGPMPLSGDTLEFIVGPLDTVAISPGGPISVTAGQPTIFSALGYDVAAAPIPTNRMTYVWFKGTSGPGDGQYVSGVTDPQATFVGTSAGGGVQLQVIATDLITGGSVKIGSLDLTVLPAPPLTATVIATPTAVTADGASAITFTLNGLTDAYGNPPLDGEVVTVTVNSAPTPQSVAGVVSGGQVVVTTTATTRAGVYTVSAVSSGGNITLTGDTSVTFLPGPPAQAQLLAATPNQLVADGSSSTVVVLQIQDAYGNNEGAGLTPVVTSTLGSIVPDSTPTDANGTITRTLQADLTVGDVTLYAAGFPAFGQAVSFVPGPPTNATVTADTTIIPVGGNTAQLVFDVRDNWDHPVANGTLITPTLTPALGAWSGLNLTINGLVTQTLTTAGSVGTAIVSSPNIVVTGDITLTFIPGPPAQALLNVSASPQTVGLPVTLTATVRDAFGNIVTPTLITMSSTLSPTVDALDGGGATVAKTTANGTGIITATLMTTVAGTDTIAFNGPAGPLTLDVASDTVVFVPDAPQYVTIAPTGPLTVRAGVPQTATVSSRDQYGNAVDPWSPVSYLWKESASLGQPGYGTLTGQGTYARTVTFMPQIVGANTLWATGGVQDSQLLTVTVIAGVPDAATVAVSPAQVLADGQTPFTVTVSGVTDVYGNTIPDGTPLTVTVPSFPPVVGVGTLNGGQMTLVLTTNTHSGVFPIEVEGEGNQATVVGDTSITFLPGPPVRAYINATPTQIPADGTSTSTLVVTVRDENFNRVADGIPITVTTTLGTVTGAGTSAGGTVTRTLVATKTLGTASLRVYGPDGELFRTGDTAVDFVTGPPAVAWVNAAPTYVVADGSSTSQLVVTVKDSSYFNVGGAGTAVLTVNRGSVVPTTTVATDGVFTVTFTSDITVGVVDLNVTYDGTPLTQAGDLLEQVPGTPTTATITASPQSLAVDSTDQSTLNVTILDGQGRPIVDGSSVTLSASLGGIVSNATTTVNGSVTRVFTPGATIGTATFTATVLTPWGGTTILPAIGDTVNITPGPLASIAIQPSGPVDVTAGSNLSFTAIGYDAHGNPTGDTNFGWRYWSGSCNNNPGYCVQQTGNGDGVLSGTIVALSPDPVFSGTVTFTGTVAGPVGIKAYTQTGSSIVFSPMYSVTVKAGAPTTATVVANPKIIPVGGQASQLVITIKDAYGNPVDGSTPVNIISDLDSLIGNAPIVNGVTTRTLVSGLYFGTVHIYVNNFEAGGDRVIFSPRAIVSASPNTLLADGVSETVLTIQVYNVDGQLVPDGTLPVITTTRGTLIGDSGTLNGVLTRTLRAPTDPGVAQFYVDGFPAQGEATFTVGPPTNVHVNATPSYLPADGTSTSMLTLSIYDDYGHIITSSNNALTVSASAGTLSGFAPTVAGVTTRVLTAASTAGKATITVADWLVEGDTDIFFLGAGLSDGGFESGALDTAWSTGEVITPTPAAASYPVYTTTVLSSDTVDGVTVTPVSGSTMVRLGATTPNNNPHKLGIVWLKQPFSVPDEGITQLQFQYRILSYDVAIGSNGVSRWDPLSVLLNGQEEQVLGLRFSNEWYYDWYLRNPQSPQDLGWQTGVLDLTPFAGQVVSLEFQLSNLQLPQDNTWVYLDDVKLVNVIPGQTKYIFLPLVMR